MSQMEGVVQMVEAKSMKSYAGIGPAALGVRWPAVAAR